MIECNGEVYVLALVLVTVSVSHGWSNGNSQRETGIRLR